VVGEVDGSEISGDALGFFVGVSDVGSADGGLDGDRVGVAVASQQIIKLSYRT